MDAGQQGISVEQKITLWPTADSLQHGTDDVLEISPIAGGEQGRQKLSIGHQAAEEMFDC